MLTGACPVGSFKVQVAPSNTDHLGSTGTKSKRMPLEAKYVSPGGPPSFKEVVCYD